MANPTNNVSMLGVYKKFFEENYPHEPPKKGDKIVEFYTKNRYEPPTSEELETIYENLYGYKTPANIEKEAEQKKLHVAKVAEAKEYKRRQTLEKLASTVTVSLIVNDDVPPPPPED